jgi:CrcB protein
LNVLLVGVGGFAGAVLRYLVSGWIQRLPLGNTFPVGTVMVNLTGCFAIGVLVELAAARSVPSVEVRLFLIVGVLGGYTTFSGFANESLDLFRAGHAGLSAANVVLSVLSCLGAVWAGRSLAHAIWG